MPIQNTPLPNLPLIKVQEHPDRRESLRVRPTGMLGVVRFMIGTSSTVHNFIGLNLSQSGAGILIARGSGEPLPTEGEISIYLKHTTLYSLPFRVAHSSSYGREHLLVGLEFKDRQIPLRDLIET